MPALTRILGHIRPPEDFVPISSEYLERSVVVRFQEIAARFPANIAARDESRAIAYSDLNNAANNLALALRNSIGPGPAPISLLLEHDVSAVTAILAVLKTGRPYLSLYPAHPHEVLARTVSASQAAGLITTKKYKGLAENIVAGSKQLRLFVLEDLDLSRHSDNPQIYASADDPFSIVYTSGSTGEPKGIVLSHAYVNRSLLHEINHWYLSASDRIALMTSMSFGVAYAPILGALYTGGAVCLFDFKKGGAQRSLDWLDAEQITVLRATPSLFRSIFDRAPAGLRPPAVRLVTLGGEPAKASDLEIFKAHTLPSSTLVNIFASTEAGKVATHSFGHDTTVSEEFLPAGLPVEGTEILLLDDEGNPVPPGQVGEIVVRSRFLASGYWRQPGLTAQKFKPDPEDSRTKLLYSGDLGRWRPDGVLESVGRKDRMVKIRGQRVELGEVESALLQDPHIREVALIARPSEHRIDQTQLVAYIVLESGFAGDAASVRRGLGSRLPDYMIPAFFVFLDRLPLNNNGKLDPRALPDVPEREAPTGEDLPENDVEKRLAVIWSEILRLEQVGAQDSFFDLGGDSLLVLSMALDVESAFGRRLPVQFFSQPTIRYLAELLQGGKTVENNTTGTFQLKGRAESDTQHQGGRMSFLQIKAAIRRVAKRLFLVADVTYIFEWFLARRTSRLPFREARALILRIANHPVVVDGVYGRKQALFGRMLKSIDVAPADVSDLFRLNLAGNLLFKLLQARRPFTEPHRHGDTNPTLPFFANRKALIDDTPVSQLEQDFPVQGLEYLRTAFDTGRGVILLSFHGSAANSVAHRLLARRIGSPRYKTITPNLPLEHSPFKRIDKKNVPSTAAAWMYSELAFHAQSLLQAGQIIHLVGDTFAEGPGPTYLLKIGDRQYVVKPGFAELSLNTGATVLPVFGRFDRDGSLVTEILPPLDPGAGGRTERIETLLLQYERFINSAIRSHPEMLSWKRIRTHLHRVRAGTG